MEPKMVLPGTKIVLLWGQPKRKTFQKGSKRVEVELTSAQRVAFRCQVSLFYQAYFHLKSFILYQVFLSVSMSKCHVGFLLVFFLHNLK
jgi:hypothetical protein